MPAELTLIQARQYAGFFLPGGGGGGKILYNIQGGKQEKEQRDRGG